MASAQVVETSVNTNNSPSQNYTTNPDDHSNHNNLPSFTIICRHSTFAACPADKPAAYLFNVLLVVGQKVESSVVSTVNELPRLLVDQLGRGLAVRLVKTGLALTRQVKRHVTQFIVHSIRDDLEGNNSGSRLVFRSRGLKMSN